MLRFESRPTLDPRCGSLRGGSQDWLERETEREQRSIATQLGCWTRRDANRSVRSNCVGDEPGASS